jgi:hypothetical protein
MARCAQVPAFVVPECTVETGRVVALAFIHKDIFDAIYADPSNASNWVDGSYSSDLEVFQEVRGTYSGGQPTTVSGLGSQANRTVNATHTLTVQVEGVKGNEDFWNEIQKSNDYRVAFVVGGNYDLLFIQNKDVSIYANVPVEEGLDTEVLWNVTVEWQDIVNPKTSNVPAGIFN